MTEKEAFWTAIVEHKKPDFVPSYMNSVAFCGGEAETFDNGPFGGGFDGFGVRWESSDTANGAGVPLSDPIILTDITTWEDTVKFPDIDAFDWKGLAEKQLFGIDRDHMLVEYCSYNAQFLRITHLMGFMEGLCAFSEEPEACAALASAISDYKIQCIERIAEYFKPDFYTSFDDVATQFSLFISPDIYRTIIKPEHKRVNDAAKAYGMLPMMHTCGKCELLISDFIDEGAVAWTSAQPANDIAGILDKYGDKISVIGGFDSNGVPGTESATEEELDAEVKRCVNEYGVKGSYAFLPIRMTRGTTEEDIMAAYTPIINAFEKYRYV